MKKILYSLIAYISKSMAVFSVNSCCYIVYGQDKEPNSLKRYKKH